MSDEYSATALIGQLKSLSFSDARSEAIPLLSHPEIFLVPVGNWIMHDSTLIEQFSRWRALASEMFFARFPESTESMRNYLRNVSVGNPRFILFLMMDNSGNSYGHIGLANIDGYRAEIDQVMKAPGIRLPGLMADVVLTLSQWSVTALRLRELELKVISFNERAIALYEKTGFRITAQHHLKTVESPHLTTHLEVPESESNVEYLSYLMTKIL